MEGVSLALQKLACCFEHRDLVTIVSYVEVADTVLLSCEDDPGPAGRGCSSAGEWGSLGLLSRELTASCWRFWARSALPDGASLFLGKANYISRLIHLNATIVTHLDFTGILSFSDRESQFTSGAGRGNVEPFVTVVADFFDLEVLAGFFFLAL